MATKPRRLSLFADHRQIHLRDPQARGDLAAAWTVQAVEDHIAAAGDLVGVGTAREEEVAVEVQILQAPPPDDLERWEHVSEASLTLAGREMAVLGCTDYLPEAARVAAAPGSWRVRAAHRGLAKGKERILLRLWPAPPAEAQVLKRWRPATAPQKRRKVAHRGPPRDAKEAAALARRGEVDLALAALLAQADAQDAAAAASAAELLAFLGRWGEMVPRATQLIANPRAVYAGNVFTDLCRLVRRAARELGRPQVVETAAAQVPAGMEARRDAVLLRDAVEPHALPGPENREAFFAAVQEAESGKRFRGKPAELSAHCFALALVFKMEDELIRRWDPANPMLGFDQAVNTSRVLARRGEAEPAWALLASQLHRWWPMDAAQVAPVILLVDPWLAPLMTPERGALVLRTPRGPEGAAEG